MQRPNLVGVNSLAVALSREIGALQPIVARAMIDSTLNLIIRNLQAGTTVYLQGLGTLKVYAGKPRKGTDGHGNMVTYPAKTRVRFIPASTLTASLNP